MYMECHTTRRCKKTLRTFNFVCVCVCVYFASTKASNTESQKTTASFSIVRQI